MIISSYDIGRRARGAAWVFLVCLTLIMIPATVGPVVELPGVEGLPFLLVFAGSWAWLSFWMAFRAIYRLDLTADELRWTSLVRNGAIPLSQLESVQVGKAGRVVIRSADRKPLRVPGRDGLTEFTAAVKRAAPHVQAGSPDGVYQQHAAKPPPTWHAVARATVLASLIGALLEAGAAAATAQPTPLGVLPGGCIAVAMLQRRNTSAPRIAISVAAAVIVAGLLWVAFASMHAARWVTVADSIVCPLAAIACGRMLELIRSRQGPR